MMSEETSKNSLGLSLVQEEIWLSQMIHNGVPLYNIGGFYKLNGFIDTELFIAAHDLMTRQNDSFKMVFKKGEILPAVYFTNTPRPVTLKNFSDHADPDRAALQWWEKLFCTPFEVHDNQLSRYYLLKASDTRFYYVACGHHLSMDGFSFALLIRRIAQNYNALVNGTPTKPKPSYSEFILSDEEYRQSLAFQEAKAYWSAKFSTIPRPVIPRRYAAGYGRNAVPSVFSHILLDPEFYDQLIALSIQHKGNVFFLLAAVLYTYFMRTTDTETFVFSMPLLNRQTPEFMETMGPFVNVIPVCLNFGLDIDIQTFFKRLKQELKDSFPFQRFPLGEINRAAGLNKTGRHQIFDISLSYERFDYKIDFNGTPFEVNTMHNGWDQTPLTVAIKEYQKELGVKLEFYYNLSAYKAHEIEFLMERVRFMLEQIVDNPGIALNRLKIIPEKESVELLKTFNHNSGDDPKTLGNVLDRVKAAVTAYPDHTAVQMDHHRLSYQALDSRSDCLAGFLRPLLKQPGSIVGIYTGKSIDTVVGMLAVIKAGGAYLPLDPDYPFDRIRFMIRDSGTRVILTQKDLASNLAGEKTATIVTLDDFSFEDNAGLQPLETFSSDHLAYVIYTSGTTGQPKGVMCTHGGLVNLVAAQNRIFDICHESRVLQFASLCFDASVSEVFTTLAAGATLVLAEKDGLMPGPQLLQTLDAQTITHVTLPPSALAVMEPCDLPTLSTLVTAGEPCPSRLFRKWGKNLRFINAYGPTEATVCASARICSHEGAENLPMGTPIDNTCLYVLNEDLEPVPLGVPGQLYIAGAGVAKGYLNQPQLTREKFIDNPFRQEDGYDRLYRTGDVVRFLTPSTMMFMGRVDHQVKIRGYRIEPEEVEKVIADHPGVTEVVVLPKTTPASDRYLAAFFSTASTFSDDKATAEIRQFARKRLPEYMIPSRFIPMETLPHTAAGKLDRRKLEQTDLQDSDTQCPRALPTDSTEAVVLDLFAKSMNGTAPVIGIHDDFFESGMDSLTAVRFIRHLEKHFNHRVLFSELMNHSTTHALARLFLDCPDLRQADRRMLVPITDSGSNTPFFCITAGFGDVVKLRKLAHHLGKDQPFFMLQPSTMDQALDAAALARQYKSEILRRYPLGPYLIGGYSAGGVMAYETARLLLAQGCDVDLLVMIGAPFRYSRFTHLMNRKIRHLILRLMPDGREKVSSDFLEIIRAIFFDRGLQYHLASLVGYRPLGYQGKIDYFQGKWAMSRFFGTHRNWMKNAKGPFNLHMLPGNHDSFMREPHVAVLAQRLKHCLNAVDREKGGYK